jgi:arylsulfatase A-like enzyme
LAAKLQRINTRHWTSLTLGKNLYSFAMKRSIPQLVTFAALMFAGNMGCSEPSDPQPPNVLLITLDTTRVDHLSSYGYERQTSPVLDAFAQEGAKFELAYSPMGTTGPSHSTIFTGAYPLTHNVVKNSTPLSASQVTLAETLKSEGYQTAAIISSFVLSKGFGYDQGFDYFRDDFDPGESSVKRDEWQGFAVADGFDRRANSTTDLAIEWLKEKRNQNRPFFLFVHYFDPHSPYDPPAEFRGRFTDSTDKGVDLQVGLYDEEIAFTDQQVGVLLQSLASQGLSDDTIVVITADHGEGLGDHDHMLHGLYVYDEAVRVPLVIRWPGKIAKGQIIEAPVEFVDLAPTLFELAGLPIRDSYAQGKSLAPALTGTSELDIERPIFLYRTHQKPRTEKGVFVAGDKFAVRKGNWKLIIGAEEKSFELYDLSSDPDEERNVFNDRPQVVAELKVILNEWRKRVTHDAGESEAITQKDRDALEKLGYTGDSEE